MGFLSGGFLTVLVWGAEKEGEGTFSLFFSPHKCGFIQYLHEGLFMDKENLPYFEGDRALEQAMQRGCEVSSGDTPTCLDTIL